jgi:hypothetical protein
VAFREGRLDLPLVAHQMHFGDARDRLQRLSDTTDYDLGSVVATHDIQRDSHKWKERRRHKPTALQKKLCSSGD